MLYCMANYTYDRERLSFTRAEMSLDMQNKSKATTAILYKKPLGLRFKPQENLLSGYL